MFEQYDIEKMPGHWLLARMGKRVLRPGGKELTVKMIEALNITSADAVVEFAPGMGSTAELIFKKNPRSYIGIDQNEEAVKRLASLPSSVNRTIVRENITSSGLKGSSATVVVGEAVLTMQAEERKAAIIREAHRILDKGGRYGIHEIALHPDDLNDGLKDEIQGKLSEEIHVNARPLTAKEWAELLAANGFRIEKILTNPMHLLKLYRVVRDEGVIGALRIAFNVATTPHAYKRIAGMKSIFTKYENNMGAISIIAVKE